MIYQFNFHKTALYTAAEIKSIEIIKLLLNNDKIDVNILIVSAMYLNEI